MRVAFTCNVCGQRTTCAINPHAYTDGTVYVQDLMTRVSSYIGYAHKFLFKSCPCLFTVVLVKCDVLVSLSRYSLIKWVGSPRLSTELTCLKDLVFVNCLTPRPTAIVPICFVLHPKRLDSMAALRERYIVKDHQLWCLFTSPCLHAGLFHLLINLSCILFVGVHMEQEFGSLRIGLIYILSSLAGSSIATLFHQDRPSVASSGALFGLLGAMLSGLIWNWKFYTKKFATIVVFFIILMINAILGLMPYVNNFSNIGGFISGLLAGFMLLFKSQMRIVCQTKGGIFEYNVKNSMKIEIKQKLDKPVLRSVSLVIFSLLAAGVAVTVVGATILIVLP